MSYYWFWAYGQWYDFTSIHNRQLVAPWGCAEKRPNKHVVTFSANMRIIDLLQRDANRRRDANTRTEYNRSKP